MASITVRNSRQNVLIDQNYVNTSLVRKSTASSSGSSDGGISSVQISYQATASSRPMLAIRSSVPCYISQFTRSGNTVTWTVRTTTNTTFTYYIFDVQDGQGTGSLVVRNNTTGRVVFDSDRDYLKVVQLFSQPAAGVSTHTLPSGIDYALIQLNSYYQYRYGRAPSPPNPADPSLPNPWAFTTIDAALYRVSGNTATIQTQPIYGRMEFVGGNVSASQTLNFGTTTTIMAIDVTGF